MLDDDDDEGESTYEISNWIDMKDEKNRLWLVAEIQHSSILVFYLNHFRPFVRSKT